METSGKQKKETLEIYKWYIKIIKQNIPLILFFLSIIGGIGQFIRLLTLSPHLLIYFSATQIIIEGVLFLFYLISTYSIYLLSRNIFDWIGNLKITILKLLIQFIFIFSIMLSVLIHPYLGFLCMPACFILGVEFIYKNVGEFFYMNEDENHKPLKTFPIAYNWLLYIILFYSTYYFYPVENIKIINILTEIKNEETNDKVFKLVFINDKYIIYKSVEEDSFLVKKLEKEIK